MLPILGNARRTDDQLMCHFEAFALPPWRQREDLNGMMTAFTPLLRRE